MFTVGSARKRYRPGWRRRLALTATAALVFIMATASGAAAFPMCGY